MFDADALFSLRSRNTPPSFLREVYKHLAKPGMISFAGGQPNQKYFAVEEIIRATEAAMRQDGRATLQYAQTEGHAGLREWIAARYRKQGLAVTADMILVTSGSQQGLDLVGKVFLDPGDKLLIERPGYQGAIHSLGVYEPQFIGVDLHDEGLDLDQLKAQTARHTVKLMETCPSFQNPSGVTYSQANREALARVIEPYNFVVIEDDPYVELRFSGDAAPALRHYLGDRLVTLGSFSKIVSPGMRLGWIVASPKLMPKFVVMKQATDLHTSYFAQRVLYQYLVDNDVDVHIDLMRGVYRGLRDAMVAAIRRHFPPEVTFTPPDGGMFIWATLPEECDTQALFQLAIEEKVAFVPGSTFYTDGGGRNKMRMSFSNVDNQTIEEGIQRLGRAIARQLDAPSAH